MLTKGVVVKTTSQEDGPVYSSLFIIRKKMQNKWRAIFICKFLNSFVLYEHFNMEGLDSDNYLIGRNEWLIKLNLQDA